jgi:hypothetical protein
MGTDSGPSSAEGDTIACVLDEPGIPQSSFQCEKSDRDIRKEKALPVTIIEIGEEEERERHAR